MFHYNFNAAISNNQTPVQKLAIHCHCREHYWIAHCNDDTLIGLTQLQILYITILSTTNNQNWM